VEEYPVTEVMSGGAGRRESQNTGGVDFGSIVCAMKMLVIGSCTGDKNVRDCPGLLTQADLDDSSLFQRGGEESPTLSASLFSASYESRPFLCSPSAERSKIKNRL
jgi:hypothetical protein